MKKRAKKSAPVRSRAPLVLLILIAAACVAGGVWWKFRTVAPIKSPAPEVYMHRPPGSVSFNKNIAPIVFNECSGCHHAGASGPFDLITYQQVQKHADQIAKVIQNHFMPPWLPEDGPLEFAEKRRLTAQQIGLIEQWVAEGSRQGNPADLPPQPTWTNRWQLGAPDLELQMPAPYILPADGKDVYRNFIIPVPLTEKRYIKAVEFHAGSKAIHHAFICVDHSGQPRRLQAQENGVGFGGMEAVPGVESLGGHFVSWQPGRQPVKMPEGLAATLSPPLDIVLQIHMQPTGKPEPIQPTIAFYFTQVVPTNMPFKISLGTYAIDIAPGKKDFNIQDSYTLPIDVELLSLLPHAHYLAKRMEAFATLPDGTSECLLRINDWDFNWQSDFRYAHPPTLRKGTTLSMRYSYDNSSDNVRNPNQPPIRVQYGPQTRDEMGELWLQLLPIRPAELTRLQDDYQTHIARDVVEFNTIQLARNPDNAHAHTQLGKALLFHSKIPEARAHFQKAVALQPSDDEAHYHLGVIAMQLDDPDTALAEFLETLHYNPAHFKAHINAGLVYLNQSRLDQAELHFKEALRINPGDPLAQDNLRLVAHERSSGGLKGSEIGNPQIRNP